MKKNGQFLNVRVEYGFGAVCKKILEDVKALLKSGLKLKMNDSNNFSSTCNNCFGDKLNQSSSKFNRAFRV